jgi:hypothetical protein
MSPRRGSTPRLTDRLTVGRNATLTLVLAGARMVVRVYWGVGGDTDKETFKMLLHTGQLRVSKFCESEMATKDTHLVL